MSESLDIDPVLSIAMDAGLEGRDDEAQAILAAFLADRKGRPLVTVEIETRTPEQVRMARWSRLESPMPDDD